VGGIERLKSTPVYQLLFFRGEVTVLRSAPSRHTANGILKQAKIPEKL